MALEPIAEPVIVERTVSAWSVVGWIVTIVIAIAIIYFLGRWLLKRMNEEQSTPGIRGFFHPSRAKIIIMLALGAFAFFGLMNCYVFDMRTPAVCEVARPLAMLPLLIVEPIGDLVGGNDVIIIALAIAVSVAYAYTIACCLAWCCGRIRKNG